MAKVFYRFYLESMRLRPWSTTILTTGVLVGTGDVLAQQLIEKKGIQQHDVTRTAKMAFLGCTLVGPGLRSWYIILEKLVSGTGRTVALKKMILDQTLWAPPFIAVFLSSVSLMNGNKLADTADMLKQKFGVVLKANYMLWPMAQLTNFYFVPFQHRVLFVNFVSLFWNTYLAWAANRSLPVSEHSEQP